MVIVLTGTGVAPAPTTLVARAAARAPGRVAAVGADGAGVAWSGVAAEARHGALGLVILGLRPGDRVAVAVGPPDRWLVAALAVIGAGGVVVPVPGALAAAAAVARTARVQWAVTDGAALGTRLAPEVTILAEGEGRGDHRWPDIVATGAAAPGDGDLLAGRAADEAVLALVAGDDVVELDHARVLAAASALHAGLDGPGAGTRVVAGLARSSPVGALIALAWPVVAGVVVDAGPPPGAGAGWSGAAVLAVVDGDGASAMAATVRAAAVGDRAARQLLATGRVLAARRWRGAEVGPAARSDGAGRHDRGRAALVDRLVGHRVRARLGLASLAALVVVDDVEPAVVRDLAAVGLPIRRASSHPAAAGLVALAPPAATDLRTTGPAVPGLVLRAAIGGIIEARGDVVGGDRWVRLVGLRAELDGAGSLRPRPAVRQW